MANQQQQQLDELQEKILADDAQPQLKNGATQLVFGEGAPDAEVVFIGEAPGKNEDLQGRPFVGAAGKFLDERLKNIGLERSDVYITNIVKYRPPGNRDPLPEEKAAFLPYLQTQLEIIQPKVVVTLGRHSMNCFLPDFQISKIHGQPKRVRVTSQESRGKKKNAKESDKNGAGEQAVMTWIILPLYHPAAALYNGQMKQTLIDDFEKIPVVLKKINGRKLRK